MNKGDAAEVHRHLVGLPVPCDNPLFLIPNPDDRGTVLVAAATIGGTSHTGGICRASGVLAGILILGVINNGLVMLKVDDNMTNIIKGLIIIGSVVLDMRKNARKK